MMTESHPTGGRWPVADPVLQQGLGYGAEQKRHQTSLYGAILLGLRQG